MVITIKNHVNEVQWRNVNAALQSNNGSHAGLRNISMHIRIYFFETHYSILHCTPCLIYIIFCRTRDSHIRNRVERAKCAKNRSRYENDPRCDKASEIGVTRLATVRCPTGLAFDIERQTCDWKTNVKNCDQLESKRMLHLFPRLDSRRHPFCFLSWLRQVYKVRPEANHMPQRIGLWFGQTDLRLEGQSHQLWQARE